jgi:hypothetical protein
MDMLAKSAVLSPRQWAMEHKISCHDSTRILSELLREHALSAGQQWTRDLVVHAWNPYPELVRAEDKEALRAAYCDVYQRFGLKIGPDPTRWQSDGSAGEATQRASS